MGGRVGESQPGAEQHEPAEDGGDGTGEERPASYSLSGKKKKKKPSELARASQRWRRERRGEGDALASTFLPILYLVGNVETQAGLSWEC